MLYVSGEPQEMPAGGVPWLTKPFAMADLMAKIRELIGDGGSREYQPGPAS